VNKNKTHLRELAALHALGALQGEDARAFSALLADSAEARTEARAFAAATEALAQSLPARQPPAGLKEKILQQINRSNARAEAQNVIRRMLPASEGGLAFIKEGGQSAWVSLPVPGAFVKVLSFDEASGHAVVLGKLEAGSRYPEHTHHLPEDIFMLSGDLHVGDQVLQAGDFHHAEAGSRHGVNWSEHGCVLLAVLSKEDLLRQLIPG
jgi:anti-sigma factor ChrR (cupin superfamily)